MFWQATNHDYDVDAKGAPANGYTEDGTVSLHGNPVLRSKTGGWKACPFILGLELYIHWRWISLEVLQIFISGRMYKHNILKWPILGSNANGIIFR